MSFPSLPLWREDLATALQENASKQYNHYIQLATCDMAGVPVCRTSVFRGFAENSNALITHTDLRSQKITQIKANNRGEICWYFSETREQFRLAGSIEIVANENHPLKEIRQQHWRAISNAARANYTLATPGRPIIEPPETDDTTLKNEAMHGSPASTFALLMFKPISVDHLLLATPFHKRTFHQLNSSGAWVCENVNP